MFRRAAVVVVLSISAAPAAAQSDILLQLRSGSPLGDRFRVDSAGGVVAIGRLGIGIIPATGCGHRMMWHPFRAAFRAGGTDDGGACDYWNDASMGFYSWAGGNLTRATAFASFAFGERVDVTGVEAAGFGDRTVVSGAAGFAAGSLSRCTAAFGTALGFTSNAAGQGSVAIGFRTTADADFSVAIGYRASTNGRTGALVLSDASTTDSVEASANNQFSSRYAGGYRLYTNATTTTGVSLAAGGASWNVISDRNVKERIEEIDGEDLLLRLRSVPVTSWNYIDEGRHVRHIGPMAQDWHAAFRLNADDRTINQGDFDGVNLAGIKALERRTTEQENRIRELEADRERQRREIAELRELVRSLIERQKR